AGSNRWPEYSRSDCTFSLVRRQPPIVAKNSFEVYWRKSYNKDSFPPTIGLAVRSCVMARVLKPPTPLRLDGHTPTLFLAGSIEMGQAEDWQAQLERSLVDVDLVLLNPRRDEWDASWVQSIDNPQFREQVEWELAGLEQASLVAMYFAPSTKAPITLLEL